MSSAETQPKPQASACEDYQVNRFLGLWNRIKGVVTLPPKLLPFLILHTLDPILFLLNILTIPFPRAKPESQHKWTLADRMLAKACQWSGWGKITESDKKMILSALNNYAAPGEEDSRSPCPGLNAMANHGFIPRHGKHVSLSVICVAIKNTYDFAPTFAYQLTSAAGFISKSSGDGKTWLDLKDIEAPNVIEHDASLLRHDRMFQPNQGAPAVDLCERTLQFAHPPKQPGAPGKKGKSCLNTESMSKALYERRLICSSDQDPNRENKVRNGQYFLPGKLKIFGAGNSAIPLILWDGRQDYIRPFFVEERLAYREGWHPYTREDPAGFFGLSFMYFMLVFATIEHGVGNIFTKKKKD
ncbi:hypothetical protein E3P86_01021 [Wallemia ichthyophaga]|uniref:Heme haloperoxidase family profile domain-containing protein n=1 Tax=Wallemia ichthyophaga TaxID=245174 RepID=A0A4T0J9S8_WALIC|nr:hypothetical protein E3P86_01021 [Wallemia ichthyophaga]